MKCTILCILLSNALHFNLLGMDSVALDESQQTIELLRARAQTGSITAQYELAWRYLEGKKGAERSTEQAEKLFAAVAEKGHAHAAHQSGLLASKRQDHAAAKAYFTQADASGEILSSYELAKIYSKKGKEPSLRQEHDMLLSILENSQQLVTKDESYVFAVKKVCANAAVKLGDMYEVGAAPIPFSAQKAEQYFRKAIEYKSDHEEALYRLGKFLVMGYSRTGSKQEGIALLQQIADRNVQAQMLLGKTYFDDGKYEQAVPYLIKAYQVSAEATHYLGVCHQNGLGRIKKDSQQALALYVQAAKKGYKPSFKKLEDEYVGDAQIKCVLGELHRDGICTEMNKSEAVRFFLLAYNEGVNEALTALKNMANDDALAQYTLGCLIQENKIADITPNNALAWFQKAALQGHTGAFAQLERHVQLQDVRAMVLLAAFYGHGQAGCQSNVRRCFDLLDQAIGLNCAEAAFMYANTYWEGQIVPKNEEEAAKWYAKAAVLRSSRAIDRLQEIAVYNVHGQCALGRLYEKGEGMGQSIPRARALYEKAAQAGFARGSFLLAELLESQPASTFNDVSAIIAWYTQIAQIYNKAGGQEALKNYERITRILESLQRLKKEHRTMDFENPLFLQLRPQLPADCSLEAYCLIVHITDKANQYFSNRVKEAVHRGMLGLALHAKKHRLAVMLMKLLSEMLFSSELRDNRLDEAADEMRARITNIICHGAIEKSSGGAEEKSPDATNLEDWLLVCNAIDGQTNKMNEHDILETLAKLLDLSDIFKRVVKNL